MNLYNIREDIQKIADAILAVLGIDVTIVDNNLKRIAGTGVYLKKVGETVEGYSAFNKSLTRNIDIIIDDPSQDLICKECSSKETCKEFAEVCCPIIYEDKSFGVIGLIAFSEEQANIIKENKDNLINFLRKMANLISDKLKAEIKTYELNIEKQKLEVVFNSVDKAIVYVDIHHKIDKYNCKFKEVFKLDNSIKGLVINNVLDFINIPNEDEYKKGKSSRFTYNLNGQFVNGIFNINIVKLDNILKGYIIEFTENQETIKNYNKINKNYKIMLENIIGNSEPIMKSKREAEMASKSSSTTLITGESGTGKELFARAIHNHSNRSKGPFIAINCAAIPDNLLESELFGYEEGAFTGAKKGGKPGMFELANKGTIFLDEIGDMSLHLQSKLLRVLQEREVSKIGARDNISIDVRIIAATNKNIENMVKNLAFREDLYYRLNVIPISLPSLKERKDDIELLIRYMINDYSKKLNKNVYDIDEESINCMLDYDWPGNIRELQNTVEYSVNMCNDNYIKIKDIPNKIKFKNHDIDVLENDREIYTLDELEKGEIIKALEKFKDYKKDKELAANALGISRATLYRKIEKYKIVSK